MNGELLKVKLGKYKSTNRHEAADESCHARWNAALFGLFFPMKYLS